MTHAQTLTTTQATLVPIGAFATRLALEFLSPIKGPNLEKILVQVGSGITSAQVGAELYDQDVKQQAQ